MYRILNISNKELSVEQLLTEAVAIIAEEKPASGSGAAIKYDGNTYSSSNYSEVHSAITARAEIGEVGTLIIKVSTPPESGDVQPEEQEMLDFVASHLLLKINQLRSGQIQEENQKKLDKAYQLARIGNWEYDMQHHRLHWSPVTKEVHGFGPDYEPDVESTINLFKEGYDRDTFARAAYDAIEHEKPFDIELRIISGQGDERWVRATGEPEYEGGICTRFYGISQNVSDRKQAEEALQLSERRFKALVQDGSDLIAILDAEANYIYVSPTSESVLGIPAEKFIGKNALDFIHEDDKGRVIEILGRLPHEKRIQIDPFRFDDLQGSWRWIETTITNMMDDPAVGGLVANSRDVTKHKLQQEQVLHSLNEKEMLLAEVHHRVKNNLAVISGLMQLQAYEEDNKEVTNRLHDSAVRIKTMANIHEQLYQSGSFSKIAFADNIRRLVLDILKTFDIPVHINIDFQCEPLHLSINQAIPCSLIVNEIFTNILKHAFPGKKKGDITIQLSHNGENNQVRLAVRDNGIGLPDGFSVYDSSSLGLNLIEDLSQQLKGDVKYTTSGEGTLFELRFIRADPKGIGNSLRTPRDNEP
ncbi:MAG: PAS domain S-box protein [Balneolales bacterium]